MHLSALFVYPVKGLRGIALDAVALDALGPVGDRRFLVVDETGRFLTQRSHARMALVHTALSADTLTLSAGGAGAVSVGRPADESAPLRTVSVWKSAGLLAEDCGDATAAWLSDFLAVPCRLVRIGRQFTRPVTKPAAHPGDNVTFADAVPLLVISEASLAALNDRLVARGEDPVPMDRFRPNLVVTGCPAHAEDAWPRFRLGEIVFRSAGPCARCVVTTTDQATAERGVEPLRTLAAYRRAPDDPTDVNFGQNLIHETKHGTLRVGDRIEFL
ncbi:MAG: MOSC domain-containing protein [Verrucomicrobia bacterium]|nr:MOSC domain-containing protein [Verrucomicrobiota bacterium]